MGRVARGYQLQWRGEKRGYTIRFTREGRQCERSTGVRDKRARSAADREGRAIHAKEITGPKLQRYSVTRGPLLEWVEQWLAELSSVRTVTRVTYEKYSGYFLGEFPKLEELTEPRIAAYVRKRLREVRGKTLRNELSSLRSLLKYLHEHGVIAEVPLVPSVSASITGTPHAVRRRVSAPDLSVDEVKAVIAHLPERSVTGFLVRARFELAYETTLRPETLDALSVPEHYAKGSETLRLPAEHDKEGFGREVPLSPRARRVLDSVCPEHGLIFGKHRHSRFVRAAARAVLPKQKAEIVIGQHLRSAAITHLLDRGAPLTGVQYLAGHKHVSTTARYVRPSFQAAVEALRKRR